jgi:LemA protein
MARRYYNGTARNFNILLQSFPSLIVGRMFSFAPAEFFEVEAAAERKTPEVKF